MSNWKVVEPYAATNICTNTSFETNVTGWTSGGTNTIAQSSAQSWKGNYSALVTYADSTTLASFAITLPTTTASYIAHCRLYVPSDWDGGNIEIVAASMTGSTDTSNYLYTDGTSAKGEWIYIEALITVGADVTGTVDLLTSGAPTATRTISFDAFNITEGTTISTHIDGDQPGCYWTGAAHGSTSVREVISRAGGVYKDFQDDFGIYIERAIGLGMPPVGNITVNRALLPGTEHQRSKTAERFFSLVHSFLGSSVSNLHTLRQALINLISPDAVPDEQPVIIEYQGAAVPKRIEARYAGGLELLLQGGSFAENIGLQFLASDPFFYGLGDEKVDLAPTSGTVRTIVGKQRGTWTVFGPPANTTASYTNIRDILIENDKSVYVCGTFTDFDDVAAADYIAHWDGSDWEAVGNPSSGATITDIRAMTMAPDGTLYVVGNFTNLEGVAAADFIAQWDGANWAAVGTPNSGATIGSVDACAVGYDGFLYVGGNFANLAGIANADNIAFWNGSTWNAMSTGTDSDVLSVAVSQNNNIYIAGGFTTAGSTAVNNVAYWNNKTGAWVSMNGGVNLTANVIEVGPNNEVYLGGAFTQTSGGDTLNRVAKWNGAAWEGLGLGVADSIVYDMAFDSNGLLWVGGSFSTVGGFDKSGVAVWDGNSWRLPPIDLPGTLVVYALAAANIDDIYIGFDTEGTAYFSQPTAATNSGTARAYPIVTITNSSTSSTLTLEEVANLTTGRSLLFDLDLLPSEEIIIDLRPGKRSMTSNFGTGVEIDNRKNNWRLLPGSDITDFYLIPGTNSLAVYTSPAAPSALSVFVRWQPAFWSID